MYRILTYVVFCMIIISLTFLGSIGNRYANGEHSVTASIPIPTGPSYIAFDPDNGRLYVTEYGSQAHIFVIDTSTNSVINTITVPNGAHYLGPIVFNPVTRMINVVDTGFNSQGYIYRVTIINPSSNSVMNSIPVGVFPIDIAVDTTNGNIYATIAQSNELNIISSTTNAVISTIPVNEPLGVAYNPSNHLVYVVNYEYNSNIGHVTVINPANSGTVAVIPVGDLPRYIAYSPSDNNMYVTNWRSSALSVIDGNTNTVTGSIPMLGNPDEIAYNPSNGKMYVTNKNAGSVSVIDPASNSFITETFKNPSPNDFAFDEGTRKIYITNTYDNTVDVITETKLPGVCPSENIQHWDKIIFKIISQKMADKLKLPVNSELDIKVPDDPTKVADIKKKVLEFLKVPLGNRSTIQIIDVDYSILCAEKNTVATNPPVQQSKIVPSQNTTSFFLNQSSSPTQRID